MPTIRAQAGRTTDAVQLREIYAFISDSHAASMPGTHADVPGAAMQPEPGSELAETGPATGPDLQPASTAGPETGKDEAVGEQLLEADEAAAVVHRPVSARTHQDGPLAGKPGQRGVGRCMLGRAAQAAIVGHFGRSWAARYSFIPPDLRCGQRARRAGCTHSKQAR